MVLGETILSAEIVENYWRSRLRPNVRAYSVNQNFRELN